MIDLQNKNILVTGATGVIGGSIVNKLYSCNANILATGTREEKLDNLKLKYKNIHIKKFDISNHSLIENFVNEVNDIFSNKIDILINNAGITADNLAIRMKEEEWNNVISLNLTSTFIITKYVIKKMMKNKNGKIINITSVVGHSGNIGQSNYAASKSGIIGMTKSLALEYGKKNIKINCISPGFIKSEMTDKISEEFKDIIKSKISLDRLGEPDDVANSVVFLSSHLSDYISGETLHVNGGMYFS